MKLVLNLETIRAKSLEMFLKELLMSVVAYNLATQFRRQAAELANLPPRRLSFKRVWTTLGTFLLSSMFTDAEAWRERYRLALRYAMQDKLPNRPGRSYEREAYGRRPKSAQFKKRKKRDPTDENPKSVPLGVSPLRKTDKDKSKKSTSETRQSSMDWRNQSTIDDCRS